MNTVFNSWLPAWAPAQPLHSWSSVQHAFLHSCSQVLDLFVYEGLPSGIQSQYRLESWWKGNKCLLCTSLGITCSSGISSLGDFHPDTGKSRAGKPTAQSDPSPLGNSIPDSLRDRTENIDLHKSYSASHDRADITLELFEKQPEEGNR